jgi:hypothetical protein
VYLLKNISIALVEERPEDTWFDLSLRSLRVGEVRFYRVSDALTGKWIFKVCSDKENDKVIIKAIKCPPGRLYSQLEGATMVFQKSVISDLFYDIVSLTYVDGEGRVRREIAQSMDDVPSTIRERFEVKTYEEATWKKILKNRLVTLTRKGKEKDMITLFLLERAWTLPPSARPIAEVQAPKVTDKTTSLLTLIRKLQKTSVTEIRDIGPEKLGIEKSAVDGLLQDLDAKGKIKSVGEGYVKATG